MSEEKFLKMVWEYLVNRYRGKSKVKIGGVLCERRDFSPSIDNPKSIFTHERGLRISSSGYYPSVEIYPGGRIEVWSPSIGDPSEIISFTCELDRIKYTVDSVDEVWNMLSDRRNWRKLGKKYRKLVAWLRKGDRLAKKATKKTGIKVIWFVPSRNESNRFFFVATFNGKDMSDEEKLKTIGKAIDALEEAWEQM